jgi:hypothetical protein
MIILDISPPLNVLHLYGTPYEMGFAHGKIMKDVVTPLFPQVFEWIDVQVQQYVHIIYFILILIFFFFFVYFDLKFQKSECAKKKKNIKTKMIPNQIIKVINNKKKQKRALPSLPEWLQEIIEQYGVPGALEATYLLTRSYTPDHFLEELQGFFFFFLFDISCFFFILFLFFVV